MGIWDVDAAFQPRRSCGSTRATSTRWLSAPTVTGSPRRRGWDAHGYGTPLPAEVCATLPHDVVVRALVFAPSGEWLVTGGEQDDRLRIWDVGTARVRREFRAPGQIGPVSCRQF